MQFDLAWNGRVELLYVEEVRARSFVLDLPAFDELLGDLGVDGVDVVV